MLASTRIAVASLLAGFVSAQEPVRYDRDIRPLLSDRCFRCHGPDPSTREAGLRLDRREDALADHDGTIALVPGQPEKSELWARVTSHDPEERMPPAKAAKRPFSKDELLLLERWIREGATYEPHWSFVPPRRPPLPEVRDTAGIRNEIDRFVAHALETKGLARSPEADRATLARRVFLDLTGLPPTQEELDAFLKDTRADAYEALVRKLLTEEPWQTRYAERMASPWLDAARYADTIGIHTDAGRSIWPYRDWVIEAYRSGMPFDRFVVEQLAGDLLPNATLPQKVASGFHRCQVQTDEGGAIPEEYIVEYAVERVATTGAALLGLTLGCARCHDHKYDPFTQGDFYAMFAFFNSIEEPGLFSQLPDSKRAFEPFLKVPSPEQAARAEKLEREIATLREETAKPAPEDERRKAEWRATFEQTTGLRWVPGKTVAAKAKGAQLSIEPDGSVFAFGANPDRDAHEIHLAVEGEKLRLLAIEALADKRLPRGRVGRTANGNAVLSEVSAVATSKLDAGKQQSVRFRWAFADHEQDNEDWVALNAIDGDLGSGWAVDGHRRAGGRMLLLVADGPFGFAGGTDLAVTLHYESIHSQHVLGRVKLSVAELDQKALDSLPIAQGAWQVVGPFPAPSGQTPFETAFGPESDLVLDPKRNFGAGNQYWRFAANVRDGVVANLPDGVHATYVGRRIVVPTARKESISLGSDDGIRFFVDGKEVLANAVDRGAAPDQEKVVLDLAPGTHVIVAKIVNTGGPGGFYYRKTAREGETHGDLTLAFAPTTSAPEFGKRFDQAWRIAHSPSYAAASAKLAALDRDRAALDAEIPRTMVMKELEKARPTYLLARGQYDKPDKTRPVQRGVPEWLGKLPEGAPRDRLALARSLVAPENPLVARVAVNRLWETFFGTGIVRSVEDFGYQGEWPSHEGLLDWLAVEYRTGGWDTKAMVTRIVTSATYRQGSRLDERARSIDPENRLLSYFPRRRLAAEQIRDLALHVSGLLVEKVGGPSVKPYQPQGLWEEVAMPQSNTRNFVRGKGGDLWRRSLYTYWKRAAPPPSMLAFDAPTRESCTTRRPSTSTPLQALVLWNDVQFVEAARVLAERTLLEKPADDAAALRSMFRRLTSREPSTRTARELAALLRDSRARFRAEPKDAAALVATGEAPRASGLDEVELAAFTWLASTLLNLDATICKD